MTRISSSVRSLAIGAAVALILGGTIAAFYNRLAGGDLILARGDTYLYFYPYWQKAAEALSTGKVPLWNPALFMGAPFLANSQIGFFYPLNWPFWLLLATPYAVSYSIMLHLLIAGFGAYLMARKCLSLSRAPAILAALLFALGGYLTAQVEHVNQVQGIAWLPWYFVVLCSWQGKVRTRIEAVRLTVSIAAILSLQILSGHTQTVFISMVAVAVWLFVTFFGSHNRTTQESSRIRRIARKGKQAWTYASPVVAGLVLAMCMTAVQVIPTFELSRLSLRQGGLPLNEVLSFSLQPLLLGQSLLPSYDKLIFSEYVAFVPITALLLAVIGSRWAWRSRNARPVLILAILGLVLAFGRFNPAYYVLAKLPGFSLFRVPARWSVLYALGIALLAAAGWQALYRAAYDQGESLRRTLDVKMLIGGSFVIIALMAWSALSIFLAPLVPTAPETIIEGPSTITMVAWLAELVVAVLLILLLSRSRASSLAAWAVLAGTIVVLFVSTRILPSNHPTIPRAYFERRAPVSQLLAAGDCLAQTGPCQTDYGRVLGLSDIFFDLGDQAELDGILGDTLGAQERFDYIVASKQKEILGPNLPLAYDLRSVDGFDGGVLPLESYSLLMSLILPTGEQTFDGRLREHLDTIPEERWLDHFGAKYIITDKVGDQWRQGIFFDMKHPTRITNATGPVNVGYLPEYEATDLYLIGQGPPGAVSVATRGAESWMLEPERLEPDLWRVALPRPAYPEHVVLRPCESDGDPAGCDPGWNVQALALVDSRDGSFVPLIAGDYRLTFSGDVKIYENLDVLPLAALVFDWRYVQELKDSLGLMESNEFDSEKMAVVVGKGPEAPGVGKGHVMVESHEPERLTLRVDSNNPALILIRETFYPGWRATIDGAPSEIVQADILFRGIFVPAGAHSVELVYRPTSYQVGLIISMLGLIAWLLLFSYAFIMPVLKGSQRLGTAIINDKS